MAKRISARRIKANRQYTYEEAAEALGVTAQTVRSWRGDGLPILSERIPHLMLGYAIKHYIAQRTAKAKRPLEDHQIYCLRCKAPREPLGKMADYVATTDVSGRLVTLCGVCEGPCNRMMRAADIPRLSRILDIAMSSGRNA